MYFGFRMLYLLALGLYAAALLSSPIFRSQNEAVSPVLRAFVPARHEESSLEHADRKGVLSGK